MRGSHGGRRRPENVIGAQVLGASMLSRGGPAAAPNVVNVSLDGCAGGLLNLSGASRGGVGNGFIGPGARMRRVPAVEGSKVGKSGRIGTRPCAVTGARDNGMSEPEWLPRGRLQSPHGTGTRPFEARPAGSWTLMVTGMALVRANRRVCRLGKTTSQRARLSMSP